MTLLAPSAGASFSGSPAQPAAAPRRARPASLLLASTPIHGHITPMLNIARHLTAAGHDVRFLTGARWQAAVERTGARFLPLPAEADFDDRDLDAAFPDRVGRHGLDRVLAEVRSIFLRPVPAQLRAVQAAIAAEQTDAVLAETMFAAMPALALSRGAGGPALISVGVIPFAMPSVDTAPFGLGIAPLRGALAPLSRLRNRILAGVADNLLLARIEREARAMFKELVGTPLPTCAMDGVRLVDAIVQTTVPEFEYPRSDLPANVHFVGPVTRSQPTEGPLPAWWPELAAAKRVVHVTQGTIANTDFTELIRPTIDGLANADGTLVVVTTGGRPVADLGPLPENVRAAEFLPYDRLLPLVDVLVTNGGYGGVHLAMERGIPVVIAGVTEDKPEVAARVRWSGVGVDLRTGRPSSRRVAAAVREVLSSDSYAAASARIGAAIARSGGSADLERIVLAQIEARAVARRG
ncbi:glycosyltransferase [Naasia aerilata]|uniref:Glycosyl transferase n=1 Tax=Naasia aerilata TaxID=1162966 RepID=A0ABN6XLV6_9MICO|nr:glycosyltransferase [Naasia aerilata]BDZ45861.1 glycosyl transferase [Naasia aerilata]